MRHIWDNLSRPRLQSRFRHNYSPISTINLCAPHHSELIEVLERLKLNTNTNLLSRRRNLSLARPFIDDMPIVGCIRCISVRVTWENRAVCECARSELVMGEDQEPLNLFTPCGCIFALWVLLWISTLFILLVGMGRRLRPMRLDRLGMCSVIFTIIDNIIFLVHALMEASVGSKCFSTWWCLPIGYFFFPLGVIFVNLCVILMVLAPPTDQGHLHDLNLRRRRQG